MFERDYIMRLIRQFFAAVSLFLSKKGKQNDMEVIHDLYNTYVGPYDFYHISTLDDVMQSFEKYPENERLDRMEMLAELYFQEADLKSEPIREDLLNKAYDLFSFIDNQSRTYSLQRKNRIQDIIKQLEKL
ncbi:MAG: hypothetical protein ACTTKN_04100 [Phocaeicola sp.]|uniref:hypothetical protein n=1 Tax=Phocaeicola TaxID=909656 RepID=UPI00234FB465|nr:hypothetical protein [Phocaeicola oris]MCE2616513.1 hypothetical protein [Phocaeicola oris]